MKVTLKITEDHIKLIKQLRFEKFNDSQYGIDKYALYGGTYLYEQMAYILGVQDKVIPESLENPLGPEYQEETQKYLEDLAFEMDEHLADYEDILHQFIDKGGIKPGKYQCLDNVRIWSYIGELD